ncbi:MBL fold metallo-hydrolase [Venenivibrio stagnispumantis]|uniref:Glyoxylase, beta-lactamase superfamily II n=1 Tax=Venenivibrio stagnispumantis TaxID=407998 RepID=A0AA45WP84_9AQUI|nr:MBL fold metallo-hydrolase [Venenivibrio stagnispumantis]MCW4573859.1 rhodanese-like domain-containing protein [Venenivibrio stagnispumantis]SMP19375.1 Glyoxylase, beta-lactamase superfamily II [Venenivibrio stagnispumantis]
MIIERFFIGDGISHISYLIAGQTKAIVIDPKRDIEDYIQKAKEFGVEIEAVLVTHLHADFIGGHYELAEKTGAKLYLPAKQESKREHISVKEGDVIQIENIKIDVLDTPGHTPEHVSYVFTDLSRGEEPVAVFTGDTLFVGDVGRPDLFPDKKDELAKKLYNSLQKLLKLPDFVEVYPAHGAGTLCGKALSTKRSSTIGYERKFNKLLSLPEEEFIKTLLDGMPPAPDHFKRCSKINEEGAIYISNLPSPKALSVNEFENLIDENKIILDTRSYLSWIGGHIPESISMDYKFMPFSLFAGWILDPEKEILLVIENNKEIDDITIKLRRVGIDNIVGYLENHIFAWTKAGKPIKSFKAISTNELEEKLKDENFILLDVRAKSELINGKIENSINIPLPELRERYNELDKNKEIVIYCGLGPRGSLAASLLERLGFENILVLAGGFTGWNNYKKSSSVKT